MNCGLGLCDRLKNTTTTPKKRDTSFLIPGTCNCEKSVFAVVDRVKDFEIRIFGYMGGSSMPSQVCLLERQRKIGTQTEEEEVMRLWRQRLE